MKYVIANWKMYTDTRGGVALVKAMMRKYRGKELLPKVVICPGFLAINELNKTLSRSRMQLGAQDTFWENDGAHTGSVSPKMLKDAGCKYVIIGHSERRQELGETNTMIARKVETSLKAGLKAIVCVGETEDERREERTREILEEELRHALSDVPENQVQNLLIAYEPIWALSGKGKGSEDVSDVIDTFKIIREALVDIFPKNGKDVAILYGGSINGKNAYSFLREDDIAGVLVGSASVKINHISDIIASALKAMQV